MTARRSLLLVLLAAVATAMFAVQSRASSTGLTTERYYTHESFHSFADLGKQEGGGPADIYVSQLKLANLNGKKIGIVNGYGVNLKAPYVFFHFTSAVGASTLTLEGAVNLQDKAYSYAIVGGTGRYAGVRGTATNRVLR